MFAPLGGENHQPPAGKENGEMKRYHWVLFFVLVFSWATLARAAGPALAAKGREFSFGEVFQGQKVTHVFHFRNTGDAPLVVERLRSTCGCTAALVSSTVVPPGGSAELKAIFDSSRFQGPVVKTVYLYSNASPQRVARFTLRGRVVREIALAPSRIDFGSLRPGQVRNAVIRLSNRGGKKVAFSALQTTAPGLTARLSATDLAPGQSARLHIRLAAGNDQRRFSGYVLLKVSGTHRPDLRIPIFGYVAGPAAAK